jgi:hypothetical protein
MFFYDWKGLPREIVIAPAIHSFKAAFDRLNNPRDYIIFIIFIILSFFWPTCDYATGFN